MRLHKVVLELAHNRVGRLGDGDGVVEVAALHRAVEVEPLPMELPRAEEVVVDALALLAVRVAVLLVVVEVVVVDAAAA